MPMCILIIDSIINSGYIDITHWFVDCHFEASSLGCHHLVFLEPEVTMFWQDGGAEEDTLCYASILIGSD